MPHRRAAATQVLELEYTLIPHGLHVVGEPPTPSERVDMLLAMAEAIARRAARARASIEALVARRHRPSSAQPHGRRR